MADGSERPTLLDGLIVAAKGLEHSDLEAIVVQVKALAALRDFRPLRAMWRRHPTMPQLGETIYHHPLIWAPKLRSTGTGTSNADPFPSTIHCQYHVSKYLNGKPDQVVLTEIAEHFTSQNEL